MEYCKQCGNTLNDKLECSVCLAAQIDSEKLNRTKYGLQNALVAARQKAAEISAESLPKQEPIAQSQPLQQASVENEQTPPQKPLQAMPSEPLRYAAPRQQRVTKLEMLPEDFTYHFLQNKRNKKYVKPKYKNFAFIYLSINALILISLFLGYSFGISLKGTDPILSLFGKNTAFNTFLIDNAGSKYFKMLKYLDVAFVAFAGTCVLGIILNSIFVKTVKIAGITNGIITTIQTAFIVTYTILSIFVMGFKSIIGGMGLFLAIILVLFKILLMQIKIRK